MDSAAALSVRDDSDLLATRYGVPEVSPLHVTRPRLSALLDADPAAPLVLVSGPAGSGKTSMVSEWLHGGSEGDESLAWVTFEDQDTRLWQPALDCLAREGLELPDDVRRPGPDLLLGRTGLAALAATLAGAAHRWTLVLDGYELRHPQLAVEVAHLLDHAAGNLRLVVVTRVDPVLPLYRYRLEDRLVEVRAADLALTDAEAAELLRRAGAELDGDAVHELNERLGGWAAGLRFATRALARRGSTARTVAGTADHDADIDEYLLGEVLDVQTPRDRQLLLATSVPDVLDPGLSEALLGPGAARDLADLARANMFLEPVPGETGCYRYPPFFRDLLRAQLAFEDPAGAAELHRRCAAWLRGQGLRTRALQQLAAGHLWSEAAAQVVEDLLVPRLLLGQDERLVELAHRGPLDDDSAPACIVRAALAVTANDPALGAEEITRARASGPLTPAQGLSATLVEAVRACTAADADTAAALLVEAHLSAEEVVGPAGVADPELEGLLELTGAVVSLRRGELDHARAALARTEGLAGLPVRFRAAVLGYQALAEALDGRLTDARRRAIRSLALADDAHLSPPHRNPAASVALALVALERDNLPSARQHLAVARASRALPRDPVSRTITFGVLAHLECAGGAERPALDHLESVSDRTVSHDPWLAAWLRVQAASLSVAHGHADEALRTLDAIDDSPEGAVLAAAAYAERGESEALDRSLELARGATRSLPVEVTRLLLEGVREARRHSPRQAAPLVERALRLASQEQARRPFREAAPSVRRLLAGNRQVVGRHRWLGATSGPVTARVGEAAPATTPSTALRPAAPPAARTATSEPADLDSLVLEPLTAKEREVLGHLEELLTTEEMADKMFVSVNTIRTHVRSILRKLGVNRRNSAVRRARELGLLDAPTDPPTSPSPAS